jgi:hypothetical protein
VGGVGMFARVYVLVGSLCYSEAYIFIKIKVQFPTSYLISKGISEIYLDAYIFLIIKKKKPYAYPLLNYFIIP